MGDYQAKVYREQGGEKFVVASGGEIDIESGGQLSIAGTSVTATAAEINLNDNQPASISFTIASSCEWKKQITLTVKDAAGTAMDGAQFLQLIMLKDATPTDFGAGTTVGVWTTGTNAASCKVFVPSTSQALAYGITSTSGVLNILWSDTGKTARYLGVRLPNGSLAITSAAITTTS